MRINDLRSVICFALAFVSALWAWYGVDDWLPAVIAAVAMMAVSMIATRLSSKLPLQKWLVLRLAAVSVLTFGGLVGTAMLSAFAGLVDASPTYLLLILISMPYALASAFVQVLGNPALTSVAAGSVRPSTTGRVGAVGAIVLALIFCAVGGVTLFGPDQLSYWDEIRRGNRLAAKIESFRREHGRLPESIDEVLIRDDLKKYLFYEKCRDNAHYVVWFGTILGESMYYDSATRKWEHGNAPCTPQ